MKRILNKLKPVALLLGMSIVSTFVVFVVNKSGIRPRSLEADVMQESIQGVESPETSTVVDTSVPLEVEEKGDDAEVLSAQSGNNFLYTCGNKKKSYIQSDSYCVRTGESQIEFTKEKKATDNGSGRVSVGADIVLAKVTVPLELLSGVEVPDSNREITSEKPTLKPAGEQISIKTVNMLVPPNTKIWEYKPFDEDIPFEFDYITAFFAKLTSPSESDGKIGVETEIPNDCSSADNKSNVNPDKSNKFSEFIYDSVYRYPGEKEELTEDEAIEECSDKDRYIQWHGDYEACKMSTGAQVIERVKRITDWGAILENFIKCEINNDPDCISTEDIIVKMDSPFGSNEDCLPGKACTNAFMNRRSEVAVAPNSSASQKYYYLTPCEAYVQGLTDKVDISCAWDMSHLFNERKVNEYDDLPTVDSTLTNEEYIEFINEKIKSQRGDAEEIKIDN